MFMNTDIICGMYRKIIYVIITNYPNLLLKYQMEVQFENLKNVSVRVEKRITSDLLDQELSTDTHILIDELSIGGELDTATVESLNKLKAKSVYAVIRATIDVQDQDHFLRRNFKDWSIVHLKYPLRTTKVISHIIKDNVIEKGLDPNGLGNDFNHTMNVSANIPIGM